MLETLLQDARYGVRLLIKKPGFSCIIILILSLGIAANTAIFSVINSVLLRPLPYKDSDRLVYVLNSNQTDKHSATSYADFRDWKERSQIFEEVSGFTTGSRNLTGGDQANYTQVGIVLPGLFQVLSVNPVHGRMLTPEDNQWGQHFVVILSHRMWQRLGGDPAIVDSNLELDAQPYKVVGIMPPELDSFGPAFDSPAVDVWIPLAYQPNDNRQTNRRQRNIDKIVARLKPGVTIKQADQQMVMIAGQLAQEYPDSNRGSNVQVIGVVDDNTSPFRLALLLVMGAVGFVLIIGCVNVTSLLLARATTRTREVAVRAALGASRGRLVMQLLVESGVLALASAIVGTVLATQGLEAIVKFGPAKIPRLNQASFDTRVLIFVLLVSLVTVVLFGLVPALRTSRPNLEAALREGGRGAAGSRRTNQIFQFLVVSQVSLTVILLIGAALMIKSYSRLQSVPPGFNAQNVLTFQLRLPASQYKDKMQPFIQELSERIKSLPGVKSAALGSWCAVPIVGATNSMYSWVNGRPDPIDGSDFPMISSRQVTADYFTALGIPLLQGRPFLPEDENNSEAAIINQAMAKQLFADETPLGRSIWVGAREHRIPLTIIGVAGDVKYKGLDTPDEMAVYSLLSNMKVGSWNILRVIVRTERDALPMLGSVQAQVESMNKNLPLSGITTMEQGVSDSIADKRFAMGLLVLLAVVALILATTGIYGVIAHSVSQRTREIGIRMALGAQKSDIYKLVLRQGFALTIVGIIIGIVGAFTLTRVMASLLYAVSATDPLAYVATIVLIALVALAACLWPARRAVRISPVIALRYE